ncbi:TetR/AcrR family transcriptional regulator [Emticicia sp. BO119]|uniref:TetR/AcrR family transcriptional regulator n=1 Tax=Emticicia sp. BO119 TaxID=2757768 RepID=UPI0015F04D72|nr:TetR/AcrR family transcriptional regulator [Emticicia sp. BO119]MBA4851982.1 TetR/AcrR family transcriptional regulator [Emticicia sp. BO119]
MVALKTFNNLSIERQTEIISVCLEEFALHEYQTASLSNIVSRLNLAKGSFYRYFENKQSLYFFLLDHCIQTRLKNDQEAITVKPTDFFELMIEHLKAKAKFDKRFPLHSAFLYNVMQEKNNDEIGNIQLTVKLKALEAVKPLVSEAFKNHVFRRDIDIEAISFLVYRMQFTILEYLELKHKLDFRQNIKNQKPFYNLPEQEILNVAKPFIEIFKTGIAGKKEENNSYE